MSNSRGPPSRTSKKRSRPVSVLLRRMGGYFRGFRKIVIIGAFLAIASSIIDAISPLLLSSGIDTIVELIAGSDVLSAILPLVLLYFGLRLASWIAGSFYTWVIARAQAGFVQSVQKDVHAHLIDADLSYHKLEQSGNVTSRVTSDTDALSIGIQVLMDISSQLVLLVVTFLVLWFTSPIVALTALITVPVVIVMTVLYGTIGQRTMLATQRAYGQVSGQIAENLSGIQIAKAFNREKETSTQLLQLNQEAYKHNFRLTMFFTFLFPTFQATAVFITAAVLFVGAGLAFGTVAVISIGELFLGVILVQRFMFPLILVSLNGTQVQASLGAMDRISDVLEAKRALTESPNAVVLEKESDGIVFDNVTFSYLSGSEVLQDVSFKINPGETVAIVGKTGAGKSTIASLINRFYDPQEGRILIGDQDIRDITLKSLHDAVSLVAQEPYLFDGTVLENMKYGAPEITDEEVKEICTLTLACEFLDTLPNGYDSLVLEGGKNLSSGQRQMITIVRTLLANPRILILDEATSRLDAYSESLVQYAQEKLFATRTTVVIAHRLSTIANADRIFVFDQGRLVETGSHDELLKINGIYKSLYETYYAHQGIQELSVDTLETEAPIDASR
ncbi:MAG: ABC transporter ATP-binding protein/permease [Candidatus Thorarchaeota archaeon]|nr:ABC transporter ATP-binding protein/permease [Candidatus Thorarchaeota archaeon]